MVESVFSQGNNLRHSSAAVDPAAAAPLVVVAVVDPAAAVGGDGFLKAM